MNMIRNWNSSIGITDLVRFTDILSQAIILTNSGIFSDILSEVQMFLFKEMHLKISYAKLRAFCLGLDVLM